MTTWDVNVSVGWRGVLDLRSQGTCDHHACSQATAPCAMERASAILFMTTLLTFHPVEYEGRVLGTSSLPLDVSMYRFLCRLGVVPTPRTPICTRHHHHHGQHRPNLRTTFCNQTPQLPCQPRKTRQHIITQRPGRYRHSIPWTYRSKRTLGTGHFACHNMEATLGRS